MPTHSINNVVSLLYLYSLLNPYEKIISGNCSETILAQSFINSNALLSLGFMNSCISENLINTQKNGSCTSTVKFQCRNSLHMLFNLMYLPKSRPSMWTTMMLGSIISSSTSKDFTYSYLLFAISIWNAENLHREIGQTLGRQGQRLVLGYQQ